MAGKYKKLYTYIYSSTRGVNGCVFSLSRVSISVTAVAGPNPFFRKKKEENRWYPVILFFFSSYGKDVTEKKMGEKLAMNIWLYKREKRSRSLDLKRIKTISVNFRD